MNRKQRRSYAKDSSLENKALTNAVRTAQEKTHEIDTKAMRIAVGMMLGHMCQVKGTRVIECMDYVENTFNAMLQGTTPLEVCEQEMNEKYVYFREDDK